MNDVKNPLLAPNKTVAVIAYFLLTLLGGGIIIIILAMFYNLLHHLELNPIELMQVISAVDISKLEEAHLKLYVFSNSIANLLMYILLFVIVLFFMRDHLIKDGKGLIKGYKKLAWLIPLCAALGYGISYGVEAGIGELIHQTSVNQSSIEVLIKNGGVIPMFFAVVVCAPIIEELIYRKAIFEYLKKFPIALSYVVSVLVFTLPHVITTFMEASYTPLENLLITIPYMLSGLLLCITYHLCNKNVYASWFFHLLNNLISFVKILLM
ncbi:MAG: CPBP family intramembrane metalloprotease [Roseburia sp.]|nr:CPBP family intramembrane metalloprotease [Anaeroplasma bactoclasticum]MCM1196831.1 CPBP family intramembrane metalloprotease [Roseburia sp.]MCM1557434.1 CPBP family intramembrane metalloprotease [Anaeroplasma bactoclasticum]